MVFARLQISLQLGGHDAHHWLLHSQDLPGLDVVRGDDARDESDDFAADFALQTQVALLRETRVSVAAYVSHHRLADLKKLTEIWGGEILFFITSREDRLRPAQRYGSI